MAFEKILIVEADVQRAAYLKSILRFIEYAVEVVPDEDAALNALDEPKSLLAVILGVAHAESVAPIRNKAARMPILLAGDASALNGVPASTKILATIELPARYSLLSDVLHKAQIFRETSNAGGRSVELFRSLVGNSRAVKHIRTLIDQVADSEANVLILGESGTGKEVVARNLHYHSSRRNKPFVPVNCGAIPTDLLESELFGHEKGAFTGAISARQGRFEMAENGTLFLDEIGDMSMAMQVKLLRVLQERTFERVGSNKTITCNVRILAATHRNLEQAISTGDFREDLFYRLNVFPIDMAPLRDRVEDVPLLINELVARIEHEKRGSVRLTPAAVMALCQYKWPGNVRELANLIERMAILFPYGIADVADLPEKFRPEGTPIPMDLSAIADEMPAPMLELNMDPRLPRDGIDLKEHLSNLEYSLIKQALDESDIRLYN